MKKTILFVALLGMLASCSKVDMSEPVNGAGSQPTAGAPSGSPVSSGSSSSGSSSSSSSSSGSSASSCYCGATTKKGKPCKNKVACGSRCYLH